MKSILKFLFPPLLSAAIATGTLAAPEYFPRDLGTLGGTNAFATGINDHSQVVGWSLNSNGFTEAFAWQNGTMTGLGFLPGGTHSVANAINNRGEITGYSYVSATNYHAFLYISNSMADLGTWGSPDSTARAINKNTELAGSSPPTNYAGINSSFLWRSNFFIQIPAYHPGHSSDGFGINDSGQVCGTTFLWATDSRWWGYVWQDTNGNAIADTGEMQVLGSLGVIYTPGSESGATDINNVGQAVGWTCVTNGWNPIHAMLVTSSNGVWKIPAGDPNSTNLLMKDLGTLDGYAQSSYAYAINDRSWIVGMSTSGTGTNQAFLWRDGVMTNLNLLIFPESGWVLTNATGINEFNEIVGSGLYNGQPRAFILQAASALSVLGTNGAPIADSEPPSLTKGSDFGPVELGLATPHVFAIRNLGASNLVISGWTTNGAGPAHFQIEGIPSVIAVGGVSNFIVTFAPPAEGYFSASLAFDSDAAVPVTNILFAATGVRHPQSIDFPSIEDQFITNEVLLFATADSGLPVSFAVSYGPARLTNDTRLSFGNTGIVAVVASQTGSLDWAPAPDRTNIFSVHGLYTLTVLPNHGIADPPAGIHTNLLGTVITNSISAPEPGTDTRWLCAGWILAGHSPGTGTTDRFEMVVTNHAVLTWLWTTNYWLDTGAGEHGSIDVADGWQPAGQTTRITAISSDYYHFTAWTGSVDFVANPLDLFMDAPKSVQAHFAENLATNCTPEWWLAEHGWTNDFDAAALRDDEPDGFPSWQEFVADTDPTNTLSYPRIASIAVEGTHAPLVTWPASTGRIYQIHFTDGWPPESWITQQLWLGAAEWSDTNPPLPARRVYRLAPLRP